MKIRKYTNGIERFLHGEKGQRFFNFAYSIGAAVVIWGALFEILHLPGGKILLCIGMGTEVAMFILTAFDRPPKNYHWEDVFPELDSREDVSGESSSRAAVAAARGPVSVVVTGNNTAPVTDAATSSATVASSAAAPAGSAVYPANGAVVNAGVSYVQTSPEAVALQAETMKSMTEQMQELQASAKALNEACASMLESCKAFGGDSGSDGNSVKSYASQMEDLSRNIAGLNTIYEIQLKSVSGQLETIDRVNRSMKDIRDMYEKSASESSRYCEETEKMARYMKQLNAVYEKMITALTINLQNPAMGVRSAENPFADTKD